MTQPYHAVAGEDSRGIEPSLSDGAPGRIRTRDPLITNQVLYQLSYKGSADRVSTIVRPVKWNVIVPDQLGGDDWEVARPLFAG
jgi:hypothetical protein